MAACSAVWVCIKLAIDCSSLIPWVKRMGCTRSAAPAIKPAAAAAAASRNPSSRGAKHRVGACTPPRTATPIGASWSVGSMTSRTCPSIPTTACVSCSMPHSSPRVESSDSSWHRKPISLSEMKKSVDRRSTCDRHDRAKLAASAARPWHSSRAHRRPKLPPSSSAALRSDSSRDANRPASFRETDMAPPSLKPNVWAAGAPSVTVGHTAPSSTGAGPGQHCGCSVPKFGLRVACWADGAPPGACALSSSRRTSPRPAAAPAPSPDRAAFPAPAAVPRSAAVAFTAAGAAVPPHASALPIATGPAGGGPGRTSSRLICRFTGRGAISSNFLAADGLKPD
mmetsp:Transcript_14589/g.47641  ORF Transcript_14589/g.47641 Transcript_14589/m.47641 type:complete len:339 (-) Transcript_14589:1196-2212(-)